MKILTVCHEGHCRSVATASCLKVRGYDAVPVGIIKNSKETIDLLVKWADKIFVADLPIRSLLPPDAQQKIEKRFTIGEDEWGNPSSADLWKIIENQLDGMKDYPIIKRDETYWGKNK